MSDKAYSVSDSHVHVFSEDVISSPELYAKHDSCFRIIMSTGRARLVSGSRLIEDMNANGIGFCLLAGFPWVNPSICKEQNDYKLSLQRAYPDRIASLCSISPSYIYASEKEIERVMGEGAVGIGEIHPDIHAFDPSDKTAAKSLICPVREANGILMVHCNEPVGHIYLGKGSFTPAKIECLLKSAQGIDLILPHWGGGFFVYESMPEIASLCERLFYDCAASPLLYNGNIWNACLSSVPCKRVLFGSDHPLIGYKRTLEDAEKGLATSSPEVVESVMSKNLISLLEKRGKTK